MAVVKFIPEAWIGYDAIADHHYVTYFHPSGLQFTDVFMSERSAVHAAEMIHKINGFKILHPDTPSYAEEMRDAF